MKPLNTEEALTLKELLERAIENQQIYMSGGMVRNGDAATGYALNPRRAEVWVDDDPLTDKDFTCEIDLNISRFFAKTIAQH